MATINTSLEPPATGAVGWREAAARRLRAGMEGIVLVLVCGAPWPFGSVHPGFELLLDAGLTLLLGLWAAEMLLAGRLGWEFCAVSLCLAGLFVLGMAQLVPLSRPVLGTLSPGTAAYYAELLPAVPEELPDGAPRGSLPYPAGTTLSLAPDMTRIEVLRLLAVFALFSVVRQRLASPAALRRLCLVVLVNGALLAAFGLAQFWTAPRNTVYWTFPSLGQVFGPFINRNHAAGYLNLCLGLGLGLLLSRARRPEQLLAWNWWLEAGGLRLMLALALVLGGIACSMSRGGLVAFMGAGGFCLALAAMRGRHGSLTAGLLLLAGLAMALVIWFGMQPVLERMDEAWEKGDPLRTDVWRRVVPLVAEFPLWGTGYGTFGPLEQMQRTDVTNLGLNYRHAHNEYVQAVVEGGLVRLLLSLAAIALVFRAGYRAVRQPDGALSAELALGALFALATVVLHSVVEFGLHVPALALLTTVIAAQVTALDRAGRATPPDGITAEGRRGWDPAPLLGALAVSAVGLVLLAEGWKAYRVDRLQQLARQASTPRADEVIPLLEAAARLAPANAGLHFELARLYLLKVEEQKAKIVRRTLLRETAQAMAALAPTGAPALTQLPGYLALVAARDSLLRGEEEPLRPMELPALRHLLQARDACPLLPGPHLELAIHARELARADTPLAYVERVKRTAPADPHLRYVCGVHELLHQQLQSAWADMHRSLELSSQHLDDVLAISAPFLSPDAVLKQLLPDRPDQLVRAATRLFPEDEGERKPFLEKALTLLEQQAPPLRAKELHLKAEVHQALEQPQQVEWHLEFAKLLCAQKRWREARRELDTVLGYEPARAEAQELRVLVARQIAETRGR